MTTENIQRSHPPEEMCNRNPNIASRSTREMFGEMRQSSRQQCSPGFVGKGMVTTPQKPHRRPCPVHPSRKVRAPSLPREMKIAKSKCPSDQDFSGLARQFQGLFPKDDNQQPLEVQKIPNSTGQKYSTNKREMKNAEIGEEYNSGGVCDLKKIAAGEQVSRETEISGKRRSSSLPKNPRRLSTMDGNQYEPYVTQNQQTQTKPINILPIQNEQIGYQQEEIYDENIIPSEADKQANNYLPSQKNIHASQFMNIPPRSRPECEFMSNPPQKRPEYVSIPAQSRTEFMNIPPRNRRESQNVSFPPRNRPESEYVNIPRRNRPDPEYMKITPQRGPASNFMSIPPQRRPESKYMNIPPQKRPESETVNVLPKNETLGFCGKPICEQQKVSMSQNYGSEGNENSKTCQELKYKCGCPIPSEDDQEEGNSKNVNFVKENEDSKNDQYYDFESTNNVNSRNEYCYDFEGENEYSKANFENKNFNSRIYGPYNFVDRNEDSRIGYQYHNFENRHVDPRIPQVASDYFGNSNRDPRMQQKPLNVRDRREDFRNDRYHISGNKPVDPRMQSQSFHFGGRNQNIDQCHDFGNNNVDPRFRHQYPRDRVEDNYYQNIVNPRVRQSPSFPDRNEDYDAVQFHDFQEDNVDPRNQQYSNLENENGNSIKNDQCNYSENKNVDSRASQFQTPVDENENSRTVQYKNIEENNAKVSLDECDTRDKNDVGFEEPGRVATKQTESNKEAEGYAECSPEINPVCQQVTPDICQSENKPCPTEKVTESDAQAINSNSNKSWRPKMNVCVKLVRNKNGELVMVKDDKCACCNHK